jgi:HNH endonuclease
VKNAVLLRDRCRCRVPGCHLRRHVEVHHLVEQSKGGTHSHRNCVTLCTRYHQWLHAGKLRIEGNADGDLVFHGAESNLIRDPFAATQRGSPKQATTQGGSPNDATPNQAARRHGPPRRLDPDSLYEATGLGIHDIQAALLPHIRAGRVAQDTAGRLAPCG